MKGKLYMIPSQLSEHEMKLQFPLSMMNPVMELRHFIVERARSTRRFLRGIGFTADFDDCVIEELNKHDHNAWFDLLAPAFNGGSIGFVSEAGAPGVADPGAELVREAHALGIEVIPLIGPSSLLLALMASGLNGQQFKFNGYLPRDRHDLPKAIRSLEAESRQQNMTQIFIETPYRNEKLFEELVSILHRTTDVCVAMNITASDQFIATKTIDEWKGKKVKMEKKPVVFLLLARSLH